MKSKIEISKADLRIETERLIIRRFEIRDIEPSYVMNLDPEVNKYTGDGGIVSKQEMERRIVEDVFGDYKKYGFGRLAVEWKAENKFIGFTGLKYLEDRNEVDIGYRFMKKYWGRGIATESGKASIALGFTKLGLDKIIALILPEHGASIKVAKKLGMKYEKETIEDNQRVGVYAISKQTT